MAEKLNSIFDSDWNYVQELQIKQEETKKQSERERLLREIIQITGSTLDINQIKSSIVNHVGKIFNADRCLIRDYDEKNNIFLPPAITQNIYLLQK